MARRIAPFLGGLFFLAQCTAASPAGNTADAGIIADAVAAAGDRLDQAERGPDGSPGRDGAVAPGGKDSGGSEIGVTTGGPAWCAAGFLFCEDFESGALDPAVWTITGIGGAYGDSPVETSVRVEPVAGAGGKQALHFKILKPDVPNEIRQAFIQSAASFDVPGAEALYIRYFTYIDDPTPNRWMTVFLARDSVTSYGMQIIPIHQDMPGPVRYVAFAGDQKGLEGRTVPLGRWSCWEYEIGKDRTMTLYVDDKPVAGQVVKNGPVLTGARLWLGILNSHIDIVPHKDGFNIWYDNIAVSTRRIGCAD